MKTTLKTLGMGIGMTLIAACAGDKRAMHTSFRTPPTTKESFSRVNLIRIYSVGALTDYFTSIDFGIRKSGSDGTHTCEILEPSNPTVAERSPSPAHLYSNRSSGDMESGNNSDRIDIEEAFYEGDNNNRNGRTDDHTWTMIPKNEYLNFNDIEKISDSEYLFYVSMDLGGYQFRGNFQIRTWKTPDGCETGAFLCTDLDANGACITNSWPNRIQSVTVHISAWRYPWGSYVRNVEATTFGGEQTFKVGG